MMQPAFNPFALSPWPQMQPMQMPMHCMQQPTACCHKRNQLNGCQQERDNLMMLIAATGMGMADSGCGRQKTGVKM